SVMIFSSSPMVALNSPITITAIIAETKLLTTNPATRCETTSNAIAFKIQCSSIRTMVRASLLNTQDILYVLWRGLIRLISRAQDSSRARYAETNRAPDSLACTRYGSRSATRTQSILDPQVIPVENVNL